MTRLWFAIGFVVIAVVFLMVSNNNQNNKEELDRITMVMTKPYQSGEWAFVHCTSTNRNCGRLE